MQPGKSLMRIYSLSPTKVSAKFYKCLAKTQTKAAHLTKLPSTRSCWQRNLIRSKCRKTCGGDRDLWMSETWSENWLGSPSKEKLVLKRLQPANKRLSRANMAAIRKGWRWGPWAKGSEIDKGISIFQRVIFHLKSHERRRELMELTADLWELFMFELYWVLSCSPGLKSASDSWVDQNLKVSSAAIEQAS